MAITLSESRPLDVRQVKTRAALRAAVLDLARERPFAVLSIADIAHRAGIGYATFFRHYRDKDALLADVAEDFISDTIVMLQPLVRAADSRSAALALCRSVETRRPICRALLVGGAGNAVRGAILERAIRQVDLSETARTSWLPESLAPIHMVTAILTIISWWLEQGSDRTAEEMSVIIDRLVLTPALIQTESHPVTPAESSGHE